MNIFVGCAHAEPQSFNGALFRAAQETLRAAGHTVHTSDLYAMELDPVGPRRLGEPVASHRARTTHRRR